MSSDFVPFIKTGGARPLLPADAKISEHKLRNFKDDGNTESYTQIKARFDPAVAERAENIRFSLSEHVASQLSVEKEEQMRFERRVTDAVTAELNRLKVSVVQQAHAEGYEAGKQEALEKERARIAAKVEGLANAMVSLQKAKEDLGVSYENSLLEVAFRIARLIVHYEVKERPQLITKTIGEILGRIAKDDEVVVKISLNEFQALDLIREEVAKLNRSGRINFELNEDLKDGDCIVESMSGEISSFIDLKFEKLHKVLIKEEEESAAVVTEQADKPDDSSPAGGDATGT